MSKFIKGAGKGIGKVASSAIKGVFGSIITEIVEELIKESGAANIAKEKMMASGFKVVKDLNMDPGSIQKELIKTALKKELGL